LQWVFPPAILLVGHTLSFPVFSETLSFFDREYGIDPLPFFKLRPDLSFPSTLPLIPFTRWTGFLRVKRTSFFSTVEQLNPNQSRDLIYVRPSNSCFFCLIFFSAVGVLASTPDVIGGDSHVRSVCFQGYGPFPGLGFSLRCFLFDLHNLWSPPLPRL